MKEIDLERQLDGSYAPAKRRLRQNKPKKQPILKQNLQNANPIRETVENLETIGRSVLKEADLFLSLIGLRR